MDLELTGKVVFIPGGSKGIGLACAKAFAQEGAKVAIAGRTAETLEAAVRQLHAEGFKVHSERADLRDIETLRAAVARLEEALGPVDVLVNSAGAAPHYAPGSSDPDRWAAGIENKYYPAVHAMEVIVPAMAARGGGVVVNIVGTGGKVPDPVHMPGGAANAALLLVSAAMARSWGHRGVRVNAINPGPTETDRVANSLLVRSQTSGRAIDEIRKERELAIPLGRYGKPEEVASMALFLASARAAYVTGVSIALDGGASASP
jgi:NAD(P)-dependent dehydrogenase (short-subunit alcohol dehydrogenase family)